jgi:hypothetical protein
MGSSFQRPFPMYRLRLSMVWLTISGGVRESHSFPWNDNGLSH